MYVHEPAYIVGVLFVSCVAHVYVSKYTKGGGLLWMNLDGGWIKLMSGANWNG